MRTLCGVAGDLRRDKVVGYLGQRRAVGDARANLLGMLAPGLGQSGRGVGPGLRLCLQAARGGRQRRRGARLILPHLVKHLVGGGAFRRCGPQASRGIGETGFGGDPHRDLRIAAVGSMRERAFGGGTRRRRRLPFAHRLRERGLGGRARLQLCLPFACRLRESGLGAQPRRGLGRVTPHGLRERGLGFRARLGRCLPFACRRRERGLGGYTRPFFRLIAKPCVRRGGFRRHPCGVLGRMPVHRVG